MSSTSWMVSKERLFYIFKIKKKSPSHGEKDFVASANRFVIIASANQNCCGDNFICSNNNMNCFRNNYNRHRNK